MGIVSERDIVSAFSRFEARAFALTVSDVFALTTITVTPDDSIIRVMRLMTLHRLRHIPVVSDRELVGIVSIGDVVKHRLEDLETETNVLRDLSIASR
jgi:CBS domain-containing protein